MAVFTLAVAAGMLVRLVVIALWATRVCDRSKLHRPAHFFTLLQRATSIHKKKHSKEICYILYVGFLFK